MKKEKLRKLIDSIILEKISGESLYDGRPSSRSAGRSRQGVFSRSSSRRSSSSTSRDTPSPSPSGGPGLASRVGSRLRDALPYLAGGTAAAGTILWATRDEEENLAVVERDSAMPYIFPVSTPTSNFNSYLGSRPSTSRVIPTTVGDDGEEVQGGGSRPHAGWDIRVQYKHVAAMDSGNVFDVGYTRRGGKFIKIRHTNGDFSYSYYYHMARIDVEEGDAVTKGQIIGVSGNTGNTTGPHLHLTLIGEDGSSTGVTPSFYRTIFSQCSSWYMVEVDEDGNVVRVIDDQETLEITDPSPPPEDEHATDDSYDDTEKIETEIATVSSLLGYSVGSSVEDDPASETSAEETVDDVEETDSEISTSETTDVESETSDESSGEASVSDLLDMEEDEDEDETDSESSSEESSGTQISVGDILDLPE